MSKLAKTFLAAAAASTALESESSGVNNESVATAVVASTDAGGISLEAAPFSAPEEVTLESDETQPGGDADASVASDVAPIEAVQDVAPVADEMPPAEVPDVGVTFEGEGDEAPIFEDSESLNVSEDNAADYADATDELYDSKQASATLGQAVTGLEELREILAVCDNGEGISKESYGFVQIALEARAAQLSTEVPTIGVDLQSFTGEVAGSRADVALENLDELITQAKRAGTALESMTQEREQRLQAIVLRATQPGDPMSMENFSISGESLDELQAALALKNNRGRLAALESAYRGIGDVRDLIEEQNAAGGLSLETLAAASVALEAFTSPLGLPEIELTPSIESLTAESITVVDLEQLDTSLEGVGDAIKAVGSAITSGARKAVMSVKNSLGMLNGTLPKSIAELEAFIAKLDKATAKPMGEVAATGLARRLHDGGKMPASMSTYLISFAGFAGRFMGPYMAATQAGHQANSKLMHDLNMLSVPGFFESYKKAAAGWQDARRALTAADVKATIPGEGNVFFSDELEYGGDNPEAKKFDKFANVDQIHPLFFRPNRKLTESPEGIKAMSLDELKKTAKVFLALLKGIKTGHLDVDDKIINERWDICVAGKEKRRLTSGKIARQVRAEMSAIMAAYDESFFTALSFGWSMARSCVRTTRSFVAYGEKCLATASTESIGIEEVSLEAADPKKLRPGVKVKFSHGHGKVMKVYTAPFSMHQKHHKASKDEPRYAVKDQHGYTTIHKASALSLI